MSRTGATHGLGPAYAIRLGALRSWHAVEVECFHCRHTAQLGPRQIRDLLNEFKGEHTRLIDLKRRLVCRRCGNRDMNMIGVVKLDRNA